MTVAPCSFRALPAPRGPATGLPTDDPLAGFLPPNRTSPEGQGFVTFTVKPRAGVSSGEVVRNAASIVFDQNPAIVTAEWPNALDADVPASAVDALPAVAPCSFLVSWSGADAGSGAAK